jgi:hypothetical protein
MSERSYAVGLALSLAFGCAVTIASIAPNAMSDMARLVVSSTAGVFLAYKHLKTNRGPAAQHEGDRSDGDCSDPNWQ